MNLYDLMPERIKSKLQRKTYYKAETIRLPELKTAMYIFCKREKQPLIFPQRTDISPKSIYTRQGVFSASWSSSMKGGRLLKSPLSRPVR